MKVIVDDCWGNHDELELEPHVTLRGLLKDMPTKTQFSPIDPKTGELYSFLQVLVRRRDCYVLAELDSTLHDGDVVEITVSVPSGG